MDCIYSSLAQSSMCRDTMYSETEIMTMTTSASAPLLTHHLRRSKSYEHHHRQCSATLLRQGTASMRTATAAPGSAFVTEQRSDAEVDVIPESYPVYKKRVSFGDNHEVAVIPRYEDPSVIWWDQVDFAARRYLDAVVVDQYSLNEKDRKAYTEAVVYLMTSFQQDKQSRDELTERVRVVRSAEVRGLESRIVPLLKTSRMIFASEVLKLQRKLRQGNLRPEMAVTMLRRKSLKLSRASRQFAFRMAQADRIDVKDQKITNGEC